MSQPRRARLRALAKINLDLRVLGKRPDGYHELRTVFQTVSLADVLEISFTPARRTRIEVRANVEIGDNLVVQAARLVLDAVRATGHLEFGLRKVIPMGAGLGGGSSDAAAALLALPVLAGRRADLPLLMRLAAEVGSDVPFFLLGGTALGLGRGAEIYPLPDLPPLRGLLAAPGVHVSTAEAYRALGPSLTTESLQNKMVSFQSQVWYGVGDPAGPVLTGAVNDFETVIFEQFPQLASVRKRLCRLGAAPARMSGSGSALFGLFGSPEQLARARTALADERLFPITLVSRARYRSLWWRSLRAHINENLWPPRSRYVR